MSEINGYFDGDDSSELLSDDQIENQIENELDGIGRLSRRHPRRRRYVKRYRRSKRRASRSRMLPTSNLTAKAEFEKRMGKLPQNIKEDLAKGRLQIVDGSVYGTRLMGGQSQIEVLHNADDKEVGKTNVNARKLEKDHPFLCTGIILTSGIGSKGDNTIEDIGNTTFTRMPSPMLNGEFNLEVGKKTLIPETTMEVFNTKNQTTVREGYYKLDNPKWIEPQTEIIFEIKTPVPVAAKTYVKVQFVGATLAKK